MDHLLSNDDALNGPKVVTHWTRPQKAAYIIADGDMDAATLAIQTACLSWGGANHALIPCIDGRISDDWTELIRRYDPDFLVDLAHMAEDEREKLSRFGRMVWPWHSSADRRPPAALIYGAIAAHFDQPDATRTRIVVPMIPDTHPMRLPLLAKWGSLDESIVEGLLEAHGLRSTVHLADFMSPLKADFSSASATETFRLPVIGGIDVNEAPGILTLPLATLIGMQEWQLQWPGPFLDDDESEQINRQRSTRILVTGRADSVVDLCLYWSIRASRPWKNRPIPLWIPLDQLATPEAQAAIAVVTAGAEAALSERRVLYVLSASASAQEIETVLELRFPHEFVTERFAEFIPPVLPRGDRVSDVVTFVDGRAHVPRSPNARFRKFGWRDRISQEVEIAGYQLPQVHALRYDVYGSNWRVTNTGIENSYFPAEYELPTDLQLPSSWRVLESFFHEAGLKCSPSNPGRSAAALLVLAGGVEGLSLLTSSLVFALLRKMADRHGRQAIQAIQRLPLAESDAIADALAETQELRRALKFDAVAGALSRSGATAVLKSLIGKHFVFRGVDLECQLCHLKRWYTIDSIGTDFKCEGCQRFSVAPLAFEQTPWQYRLNELCARSVDQGTLAHLLLAHVRQLNARYRGAEMLGFYPGVDYFERDDEVQLGEIDYVEINSGRLVVGECKLSSFGNSQQQVSKLARLARRLDAVELILASTSEPIPAELDEIVQAEFSGQFTKYEPGDLFDRHPWTNKGTDPRSYLEDLTKSK